MPGSDQGAQSRATRWTRLADPERLLVAEHSLAVGDVAGTEAPQELCLSFVTPIKAPWELKVWDQWEDQGHECADDRGSLSGPRDPRGSFGSRAILQGCGSGRQSVSEELTRADCREAIVFDGTAWMTTTTQGCEVAKSIA